MSFLSKVIQPVVVGVFLYSLLVSAALSAAAVKKGFIMIGTGSMSGVYYPIGSGVCRFIAARGSKVHSSQKLICSTSATAGSVYNLNSLRREVVDIGASQSDVGYYAYMGKDLYKDMEPMRHLRRLVSLHKEYLTIIVRKDSGIMSIEDLKGKRINIGAPGTGVRIAILSLLKEKGWTTKDFLVTSDLRSSEQVQALCDGKIDVITDFIGHPNAAMQEASATCGAVSISLDDDLITKLVNKYPYYEKGTVPGDTYSNNPNDMHTISVRASLYATTSLSDSVAYLVVDSIASNLSRLHALSSALKHLTIDDLVGSDDSIPLHDGAAKFYKEKNLLP